MDISLGTDKPGGMSAVQKECFNYSAGLTFLDLRVKADGESVRNVKRSEPPTDIGIDDEVMVRCEREGIAGRFLAKAFESLVAVFKSTGWGGLQVWVDDGTICARFPEGEKKFTESIARDITTQFETHLKNFEKFEWKSLVHNIVDESKNLILSLKHCSPSDVPLPGEWEKGVHSNLDKDRAKAILAEAIVPMGLPSMEYNFSAGGSHILYPNPAEFNTDHWELWGKFSPFTNRRGFLDFVYGAAVWLPHEVLHCIQDGALSVSGAADGSEALHNWQCEYCVCFGQGIFLATIISENRKKGVHRTLMLPAHFLEESYLWLESCCLAHPTGPPSQWLSDKAAVAPSSKQPYDVMEETLPEYLSLLGTVAVESFKKYQKLVEKEEQETSYWAAFVKYANRMLQSTSADKIPEVTASLIVE
eukprot:TRINITY_DN329_c0_g1_i1.p1 TRINITY_DN329_c0_g1~~TRINITY_DN329_c0_g1_i1.p1  ORF type:complete len:418 (+),score=49.81 TRINITY_DN329_c0_g1_i1:54-1307(+)